MQVASHTQNAIARATAWAIANPAEMAWLAENMEHNDFALSLAQDVERNGALSSGQILAIRNNIVRGAERSAARQAAPAVTVAEIEAKFGVARGNGVKKPAMRLDTFVFKAAGDNSANAGGIYVTEDSVYLGKVLGGKFLKTRDCTDDQQARIVAAAENPDDAAKVYGQRTGNCSVCGRELTAEESIERFIGPICLEKFGLRG